MEALKLFSAAGPQQGAPGAAPGNDAFGETLGEMPRPFRDAVAISPAAGKRDGRMQHLFGREPRAPAEMRNAASPRLPPALPDGAGPAAPDVEEPTNAGDGALPDEAPAEQTPLQAAAMPAWSLAIRIAERRLSAGSAVPAEPAQPSPRSTAALGTASPGPDRHEAAEDPAPARGSGRAAAFAPSQAAAGISDPELPTPAGSLPDQEAGPRRARVLDAAAAPLPPERSATSPRSATGAQPLPVAVVADQQFPAPASVPGSITALHLAEQLGAAPAWHAPAALAAASRPGHAPAHSLRLELHPAELGMVTAEMHAVGDRLTVELKVESDEAARRLTADSDTIVKAMRALGLEIDAVRVTQPNAPAQRADAAGGEQWAGSRDHGAQLSGQSGGEDRRSGKGMGDHGEAAHRAGGAAAGVEQGASSGRGVYI